MFLHEGVRWTELSSGGALIVLCGGTVLGTSTSLRIPYSMPSVTEFLPFLEPSQITEQENVAIPARVTSSESAST